MNHKGTLRVRQFDGRETLRVRESYGTEADTAGSLTTPANCLTTHGNRDVATDSQRTQRKNY
jgi:hypothetical protein